MDLISLPPSEFESLAADILSVALGVRFERFGEGRDGGIDCQHEHIDGGVVQLWVGQAKRYSNAQALLRQMKTEHEKMQRLARQPARYFLVVACALLPQHKERIKDAMQPYILSLGDIYGADDIKALFQQHPALYSRHHRLWLHSIEQLKQQLYASSYARSEAALNEVFQHAQCFINHPQMEDIKNQLTANHACFIVGDPGSGKTTAAAEIALRYYLAEPALEVHWFRDRSFEEALQLVRKGSQQLFVLDDCFGATFLTDDTALKQHQSWQALLHLAMQAQGKLKLIFTSRDYILQQALRQMQQVSTRVQLLIQQAVRINVNNAVFRAAFVHQTLTAQRLSPQKMQNIISNDLHWAMITDANFSPRMIELLCSQLKSIDEKNLEHFVLKSLKTPINLWRDAYDRLSDAGQTLTLLVGLTNEYQSQTSLQKAFLTLYHVMHGKHANTRLFEHALLEAEPVFIHSRSQLEAIWVSTANPGVNDFIHAELNANQPLLGALIGALTEFTWGINVFAINPNSHSPLRLNAIQSKQLLEKLVTLLNEPTYRLLQRQDTGEWEKQLISYGERLTQLWRKVQYDVALSQWLYTQLASQILTITDWPKIVRNADLAVLLDLSLYCASATQKQICQAAQNNLLNSEDAAALAEFYAGHAAMQMLLGSKAQIIEVTLNVCMEEILRVNNPDYLQAIFEDLQRIEQALDADIGDAKLLIYRKIDPYDDSHDLIGIAESEPVYYAAPSPVHLDEDLLLELGAVRQQVREWFELAKDEAEVQGAGHSVG